MCVFSEQNKRLASYLEKKYPGACVSWEDKWVLLRNNKKVIGDVAFMAKNDDPINRNEAIKKLSKYLGVWDY